MSDNLETLDFGKEKKYQIVLDYIKDFSFEIPSAEAFINSNSELAKYETKIEVSNQILKNKLNEINLKLIFQAPNEIEKKIHVELCYTIVFKFLVDNLQKNEIEKIILAEIPDLYSQKISDIISSMFKQAGFNSFTFRGKFNFLELFKKRNSVSSNSI